MTLRQKVLLTDVDGVLADFTGYLLDIVHSKFAYMTLKPADVTSWDVFDLMKKRHGPDTKELAWALCDDIEDDDIKGNLAISHILRKSSFWETIPVIVGAVDGLAALRAADYRLVAVTAPWAGCRDWGYKRGKWLTTLGFDHKHLVIAADKHYLRGDIFLDDKPENIEMWAEANPNGRAVLYDAPYNQSFSWPLRFQWGQPLEKLTGAKQ